MTGEKTNGMKDYPLHGVVPRRGRTGIAISAIIENIQPTVISPQLM
jgi:hypothetical protein